MEELRLLTNLQQDGKPLLQIFLLGQPELRDLIHQPSLEQVHQRIIATSHLQALKQDETRAYIEHRLKVVGWRNHPAISSSVFPIIFRFSEGVPRRINLMCSRLFLHCFVEQRRQITVADARTVVEELQEEQLSTHNFLNDDLFFAQDVFEEPLPQVALVAAQDLKARAAVGGATQPDEPMLKSKANVPADFPEKPSRQRVFNDSPPGAPTARARPPVVENINVARKPRAEKASLNIAKPAATSIASDESAPGQTTQNPEKVLRDKAGDGVNMDTLIKLLAALVAGGVVFLMAGVDRFM
jgi:hypothetical protein